MSRQDRADSNSHPIQPPWLRERHKARLSRTHGTFQVQVVGDISHHRKMIQLQEYGVSTNEIGAPSTAFRREPLLRCVKMKTAKVLRALPSECVLQTEPESRGSQNMMESGQNLEFSSPLHPSSCTSLPSRSTCTRDYRANWLV
jgi:hypothetical protein